MIIGFLFFMFVILSCHSAKDHNISKPICPESFNCTGLAQFKYPFYNVTDTRCGLVRVNCTSKGAEIEFGGGSYEIINKFDSDSSFMIHNRTFEELIKAKSCEALNNFTSPTPLLFSISITPFITFFKCTKKNLSYTQQMDAYFKQPTYNSYNLCKDYNFYYNYSVNNGAVPSDLPHSCQVIRLPVLLAPGPDGPEVNYTKLFFLINSYFSISFQLSPSCIECQRIGGQCYARYGIFQCLDAKQDAGKKSSRVILVTALIVGSVTILSTMVLCFRRKVRWRTKSKNNVNVEILSTMVLCFRRKVRWRTKSKNNVNVEIFLKNHEFIAPKRYSYSKVQKMTNSFEVKLGQGGFGSVYKGALSDQNLVAVKVLSELKGDGEDFINEVASVGSTSHVNIVSLVGYCLEGRRKALIYEFMPNGSLERFIYGRGSSTKELGWEKLHQIAIGIARGLEYLHMGCNTRILHLDIKPHNILLDQDFCPKISDFGLAKLFSNERSMISMSRMRGTPGYIAPELFSRNFGQVSHKSDVYSYGMLILEMVGGRRNIEVEVDHSSEIYFPHWIYKKIVSQEEEIGLHGILNAEENETVRKMIIVGLWCIQTNPLSRPTISKVLEMLEDNLASLEIPAKPYIFSPSRSVASSSTSHLSY